MASWASTAMTDDILMKYMSQRSELYGWTRAEKQHAMKVAADNNKMIEKSVAYRFVMGNTDVPELQQAESMAELTTTDLYTNSDLVAKFGGNKNEKYIKLCDSVYYKGNEIDTVISTINETKNNSRKNAMRKSFPENANLWLFAMAYYGYFGWGENERNLQQSFRILKKIEKTLHDIQWGTMTMADQKILTATHYMLGLHYEQQFEKNSQVIVFEHYKYAADNGHALAQYRLGKLYMTNKLPRTVISSPGKINSLPIDDSLVALYFKDAANKGLSLIINILPVTDTVAPLPPPGSGGRRKGKSRRHRVKSRATRKK
jgi:hypothetical protein